VLIKLAATWEGIKAAEQLEKEGITCNLTLLFGFTQAVACAQAGVTLISPFPGRVLDWHKLNKGSGSSQTYEACDDPGAASVKRMFSYYKKHGHQTICMPASWRPSRGPGFETDEILALAGVDRMTIPPPLLDKLGASQESVPKLLDSSLDAAACEDGNSEGGSMSEKNIPNDDECGCVRHL